MNDEMKADEKVSARSEARSPLAEEMHLHRARGRIIHCNAKGEVLSDETVYNVKTTVGIDFLLAQGYGTAAQANGLNYIALSNDTLTETTASTVLSAEIVANGLQRAIGAYAHTPGTGVAVVSKTFTCGTAPQAAQKAALFSAGTSGTMNHVLAFTPRSLQLTDTLYVEFTLTLT